jgi:hypothetical protein
VAGHHLLIAGTVNPEAAFLWLPGRLPGPTISAARLIMNTCPGAAMRSGGAIDDASSSPIPRRQGGEIIDLVIGDAGQHIGEPGMRIDIVGVAVWISVI